MNEQQLRDKLEALVAYRGYRTAARDLGFSHSYLQQVIVGAPISDRLAAAMGYERRVKFVRLQEE